MSEGLAGGYPGAPNSYVWVKAPAEGGDAPVTAAAGLEDIAGEHERVSWGVFPLMGRDALYVRWNGGGGYGDPIARDPEAVATDVTAGLVSADSAKAIYGVALKDGAVDGAATDALRIGIRKGRLAGGAVI
jgi:N-methylhydantoinase B